MSNGDSHLREISVKEGRLRIWGNTQPISLEDYDLETGLTGLPRWPEHGDRFKLGDKGNGQLFELNVNIYERGDQWESCRKRIKVFVWACDPKTAKYKVSCWLGWWHHLQGPWAKHVVKETVYRLGGDIYPYRHTLGWFSARYTVSRCVEIDKPKGGKRIRKPDELGKLDATGANLMRWISSNPGEHGLLFEEWMDRQGEVGTCGDPCSLQMCS